MTADFYLDAIRILKSQGMTTMEAVRQFDRRTVALAMMDELGTQHGNDLLDVLADASRAERNARDLDDALELWGAGWTSECGNPPRDVFSWYWRAPAKGQRPRGRFYPSTQQALNAYRRALSKQP